MAAAKLVVSDKGDILSPKYAPEIIAPHTKPSFIFNAVPMLNKAIPKVAIVDQELPVANEIIAHIIQQIKRKISGFSIFKP